MTVFYTKETCNQYYYYSHDGGNVDVLLILSFGDVLVLWFLNWGSGRIGQYLVFEKGVHRSISATTFIRLTLSDGVDHTSSPCYFVFRRRMGKAEKC